MKMDENKVYLNSLWDICLMIGLVMPKFAEMRTLLEMLEIYAFVMFTACQHFRIVK